MKLLPAQTGELTLSAFGEEACAMLMRRDYTGLANRFGYAVAYDRAPASAIQSDFLKAVASLRDFVSNEHPSIVVKYFTPNDTGLFAVVECTVPVGYGASVLLHLVVTRDGEEKHIVLEDISSVSV